MRGGLGGSPPMVPMREGRQGRVGPEPLGSLGSPMVGGLGTLKIALAW